MEFSFEWEEEEERDVGHPVEEVEGELEVVPPTEEKKVEEE